MPRRKISIRRLFDDYCEIVQWSQPGVCSVEGCAAPAALSEYGTICLAGHVVDAQGAMPISRTADLALAIVPAVRRDAGKTTYLHEALKRYEDPAKLNEKILLLVGYILDTLDKLAERYPHGDTPEEH